MTNNRITFKGSDGEDWEQVDVAGFGGPFEQMHKARIEDILIRRIDKPKEEQYPCHKCGKLRTKDQGGTTFTLCDDCWEDRLTETEKKTDEEWASYIIDEDSELRIVEMVNYKIAALRKEFQHNTKWFIEEDGTLRPVTMLRDKK